MQQDDQDKALGPAKVAIQEALRQVGEKVCCLLRRTLTRPRTVVECGEAGAHPEGINPVMLRMTITVNAAVGATERCLSYAIRTRQLVEANQRAAEGEERLLDLVVAFAADRQTAASVEPRQLC